MIQLRTFVVIPFLLCCLLAAKSTTGAAFEWFPTYSENQSFLAGGCTDMGACNYNPAASFDDGSCCYSNCFTLTVTASAYPVEVGYILENSDGIECCFEWRIIISYPLSAKWLLYFSPNRRIRRRMEWRDIFNSLFWRRCRSFFRQLHKYSSISSLG
jgi:hypothetical protein